MSSIYDEAAGVKRSLTALINECIASNETIKSCIKAKRATVTTAADETTGKVGVTLTGDTTEILIPYSSAFSATDLIVGVSVSVWYNYSLSNGIVMQNSSWTK